MEDVTPEQLAELHQRLRDSTAALLEAANVIDDLTAANAGLTAERTILRNAFASMHDGMTLADLQETVAYCAAAGEWPDE